MRRITRIFVYCTTSNRNATFDDIAKIFKDKGWKKPGYHYLIDKNGQIRNTWPGSDAWAI